MAVESQLSHRYETNDDGDMRNEERSEVRSMTLKSSTKKRSPA